MSRIDFIAITCLILSWVVVLPIVYLWAGVVYLEEDCDLQLFVEAYKAAYGREPLTAGKHSDKYSFIRTLPAYNKDVFS